MIEFLAYRIIDDKLNFKNVPSSLKNDVRTILIELGHGDLTSDV